MELSQPASLHRTNFIFIHCTSFWSTFLSYMYCDICSKLTPDVLVVHDGQLMHGIINGLCH